MQHESLGYAETLAILPFDHRSFFVKEFDFEEPLTPDQFAQITDAKQLVYEGFLKAIKKDVPVEKTAILVDDVFGKTILEDANVRGIMTLLSTEKSGAEYFQFEHGDDWQASIARFDPTFVKALVRYNPGGDTELNKKSLEGLRRLSDFAHQQGYKFLIEPLVPPTPDQLEKATSQQVFDTTMRPNLTARMITEMQAAGVEPDIWKIEGFDARESYETVAQAAHQDGRTNVGIIALGRGEDEAHVESWLRAGKGVPGVIGFAVGRTVFLKALNQFRASALTREEAANIIAERFTHFYKIFTS